MHTSLRWGDLAAEPLFEPVACGLDAALGQFRAMIAHQIALEKEGEVLGAAEASSEVSRAGAVQPA